MPCKVSGGTADYAAMDAQAMPIPLTEEHIMLILQNVGFDVHEDYDGSLFDGDDETLHVWDQDGNVADQAFIDFARAIEREHGIG